MKARALLATGGDWLAERILSFGRGLEPRDFLHSIDVGQAAICLADAPDLGYSNSLNDASGRETQVRLVSQLLCENCQGFSAVFTVESRAGDPQRRVADLSELSGLGFSPQCGLEDGVSDYLALGKPVSDDQHQ